MKTRVIGLVIILGLTLLINCNNDDGSKVEFESTAIITGIDTGACICCSGYLIKINEQEYFNRFSELPENSNIDLLNTTFPISVQLNWSLVNQLCEEKIIIESIELIE